MLFSKILRDKFLKAPSVRQSQFSSNIAVWAQQILTGKEQQKSPMKVAEGSIKITKTVVTFELVNNRGKHHAHIEFYKDGLMNFSVQNPNNLSGFNFYDVEPRPNLHALTPKLEKNERGVTLTFSDHASNFHSKYKVVINLEPFNLKLINGDGKVLVNFNPNNDLNFTEHVLFDVRFPTHHLWGLAERADTPYLHDDDSQESQREREPYKLWARDHPKYKPYSPIGLYGSIPIVANLHDLETRAMTAMFQANPSETYVEVNKDPSGHSDITWINDAGDLEIYFIAADNLDDYFYKSAQVTGFGHMPPMWALGFHQCRWGYLNEDMVDDVNAQLKEHKIPCDSITLDIDYTDGFKYFTWNHTTFPDPGEMIKRLRQNKRRLICINDPHIKHDESYHVYKHAKDNNMIVRDPNGEEYVNLCWPGKSVWLDFTNPEVQDYWSTLYHYKNFPYSTKDVHAWNDMNEPAVFDPTTDNSMNPHNRHTFIKNGEKKEVEHKYIHNMYGHLQARSTFKGMCERDAPNKLRPFILTRSFFAGTQKYSSIWSGDAGSKWSDLSAQVPMALNTSLCGISFCGGDVGGFMGDPSQECAVRWFQGGSFMPFFRAHSDMNTKRREPYIYDPEYREPIIKAIFERYRWLYYWYGVFEEYVRTGYPIMRTIWMQKEITQKATESLLKESHQYFVGDNVLVIPVVERYRRFVQIHEDLQKDEWFTHESGHVTDPSENYKCGLDRIGVFIRAGSVIPLIDVPAEFLSSEDLIQKPLHLWVTVGKAAQAKGYFYDDDLESFDYENKHYLRREFELKDGKFTNKSSDTQQINDRVIDKTVSVITLCGTTEDILRWTIVNNDQHNLKDHTVDLSQKDLKIIHFRNLHLPLKVDWTLEFTK